MLDPHSLFGYEDHVDARTVRARTLLVTLGSFVDAGHAQRLLNDHLLNTLTNHRIGAFDADQLISYREQRPPILFTADRFSQYKTPALALHEVTDAAGQKFLLLVGPEPGLQWERMAACIADLVDRHDVALTVLASSMPMAAPHTRPVQVSRWATRSELLPDNRPLFGTVLMSAAFPSMLAQRLGERGHDAIGLTAHVPHYLADHDFPDAAIALVDAVRTASGLSLPTLQLAVASGVVRAQIGHQVEQSEELAEHVAQLEEAYDEFHRQRELEAAASSLPSAEEIGEAAEEFLKTVASDAPGAAEPAEGEPEDDASTDDAPPRDDPQDGPGQAG